MPKNPLAVLMERLLPESLQPVLRGVLGRDFPRVGEGRRFRMLACGPFRGALTADLLTFAHNQKLDAAMVIMEEDDTHRVLYFHEGVMVAADSNVLFERLGRLLHKGGVIDKADAEALVDCEEKAGLAKTIELLPEDAALWGLERRAWEVGTSLAFMPNAHFLLVQGRAPLKGVPLVSIEPVQLAIEALRRYDEWRNDGNVEQSKSDPMPISRAPMSTPLDRAAIEARARDADGTRRKPKRERASAAPNPQEAAEAIMKLLSKKSD